MQETEHSGLGVDALPFDALAPKVTRPYAGMILAV